MYLCAELLQSCPALCHSLWTVARQALLSMGFSRQEHWSGLPCPPPGHLPNTGVKPTSLMCPAVADRFFTTGATSEALRVRGPQQTRTIFSVSVLQQVLQFSPPLY